MVEYDPDEDEDVAYDTECAGCGLLCLRDEGAYLGDKWYCWYCWDCGPDEDDYDF